MANNHTHDMHDIDNPPVDLPEDLRELAGRIEAMPGDVPRGLEARVFSASVGALREHEQPSRGIVGKIGFVRWTAPVAAAAALGLLAWAGAVWLSPANTTLPQADATTVSALDEHVEDALAYADLFAVPSWGASLVEDAEALDESWEPSIDAWSLDGEYGASS